MTKISPTARRRVLKQAMQQMCLAEGRLTPNARLVLIKLRRFCHAKGGELMIPKSGVPVQGRIDPLAMARVAGRREVFDYLTHLVIMNLEEGQNLIEGQDEY